MDFGLFFLVSLLSLAFVVALVATIAGRQRHTPATRRGARVTIGLAVMLVGAGGYLYEAYFLDEALATASSAGELREVESLLARGASPDAQFEGRSALDLAKAGGDAEVVALLNASGAKE